MRLKIKRGDLVFLDVDLATFLELSAFQIGRPPSRPYGISVECCGIKLSETVEDLPEDVPDDES